ncbi:MAG: hypothetical protein AB7K24_10130 [Gemmataceae bacterium]
MSNLAILFADHAPSLTETKGPHEPRMLIVAGCRDCIPAFWLFCFDEDCLADMKVEEVVHTALVSPLPDVRQRLAARDSLARSWFPGHVALWERWLSVMDLLNRPFLKIDASPLDRDPVGLGGDIINALEWFESDGEDDFGLQTLLELAGGAQVYDLASQSFRRSRSTRPEVILVGGGHDFRLWEEPQPGPKKRPSKRPAAKRRGRG